MECDEFVKSCAAYHGRACDQYCTSQVSGTRVFRERVGRCSLLCNDLLTHGCIGTVQSFHKTCFLFFNSRSNHCKNSCLISSL